MVNNMFKAVPMLGGGLESIHSIHRNSSCRGGSLTAVETAKPHLIDRSNGMTLQESFKREGSICAVPSLGNSSGRENPSSMHATNLR